MGQCEREPRILFHWGLLHSCPQFRKFIFKFMDLVFMMFFSAETQKEWLGFPAGPPAPNFLKRAAPVLTSLSSKGNFYGVLTPSGNPCSQSLPFLIQCQQFPRRSLRPSPQPPIALPWFRSTLYLHPTSDLHQATNSKPSHLVCRSPLLCMPRPVTF